MQIGFVGLGRMGGNMVHRILRDSGHEVAAFDPSGDAVSAAEGHGASGASSLEELVQRLDPPRAVWMMVPAGDITESTFEQLLELLGEGDLIVDGGNSKWTESVARGERALTRGIEFVDVGTSGGVWGLDVGYCMMVGGSEEAVARLAPILDVLAPPDGWARMGPSGSGHYVKMVHNGVEYALMQGYAEGFEIMHTSQFDLDLGRIADLWMQGSVVRSWLLELAAIAFKEEGVDLEDIKGYVQDSGEGRWTIEAAIAQNVPAPTITLSLMERFHSRQDESYAAKVLAALRAQFGGHAVQREGGGQPADGG
jgi:6-phosphogluconate dehydrogenase